MRKILLALCMTLLTVALYAVPAKRTTFTATQSDGTKLTLMLVGDEYMHYYLNVATNEKMQRGEDGDFYVLDESEVGNMTVRAQSRRTATNQRRQTRLRAQAAGPARVGSFGNMTGLKKGIVILVNFQDKAFNAQHTNSTFDAQFNEEGYSQDGHIGSVADYFKAQSYGQFELSFDVVGPVTLSNNMAYYGGNDRNGDDTKPGQMVKEACNAVNSQVNFADYDWDGDGTVDQVFIIYAGYGENYSGSDPNTIWPHEWDLQSATGSTLTLDGTTISTYACCAELYGTKGSTLNGIGTACHEFSHCLGYPDSYDTDYSGGVGMDAYDVMCGGSYNGPNGRGEVPSGYTAYQRWMAGWLEPTELSTPATITDMKDLGTAGEAYIIYNTGNRNEYFMLENRQAKGWFRYYDSYTAGHGLLITHIDYNSTVWNNNAPNDVPSRQRLAWVPADKKYGTYSSTSKSWVISSTDQQGDYFPGTGKVTSFKPTASAWNTTGGKWFTSENGSYYTSHDLSEITENTTNGTISFLFDGGLDDDGTRYTITLDACGGTVSGTTTWTQTAYKEAFVLPEPLTTVPGWYSAGWSTKRLTDITALDDVDLIDYGKPYTPESDVTLYAVYMDEDFDCLSTPANFTITFNPGAGTCTTSTWTQGDSRSMALPTCTDASDDWKFAGWASTPISIATTTPPTLFKAGDDYKPTADVTLYAVYMTAEGGGEKWKRVAAADMKEAGTYALITTDGHAFNGSISNGHGQVTTKAFAFDSNGEATTAPEGTCELRLTTPAEGGFKMYNAIKGYLYAQAAKSGNLAWHEPENSHWIYKSNNWVYSANTAYLRDYNNGSFRTYGSDYGSVVQFAQKVAGVKTIYHSTPGVNVTVGALVETIARLLKGQCTKEEVEKVVEKLLKQK